MTQRVSDRQSLMTRRKPSGISWITSTSKPEHTKYGFTLIVPDHSPDEYDPARSYSGKYYLSKVLNVLQIANKYCAAHLEKVAAAFAEDLTKLPTLQSH